MKETNDLYPRLADLTKGFEEGTVVSLGKEIRIKYSENEEPVRVIIVTKGELAEQRAKAKEGLNIISSDYPLAKMLLGKPYNEEIIINIGNEGPQTVTILEPEKEK